MTKLPIPLKAERCLKFCYTHALLGQLEFEIRSLIALLDSELKPVRVVELGTYFGGTAALFAAISEIVVTVDTEDRFNAELDRERIERVIGNTHEASTLEKVRGLLRGPADLLFIDAGHFYDDVKADFETWRGIVRPGGWIVFHDIDPGHVAPWECQVSKFWKELLGDKTEIIQTTEHFRQGYLGAIGCGGIGLLKLPDVAQR